MVVSTFNDVFVVFTLNKLGKIHHLTITSWWFQICFIFTPILGEMIRFNSNGLKQPTVKKKSTWNPQKLRCWEDDFPVENWVKLGSMLFLFSYTFAMTEMRCQVEMWCERLFHPLLWGSWHCASRSGLPGVVSWGGQEVTVMRALFLEFVEKWQ